MQFKASTCLWLCISNTRLLLLQFLPCCNRFPSSKVFQVLLAHLQRQNTALELCLCVPMPAAATLAERYCCCHSVVGVAAWNQLHAPESAVVSFAPSDKIAACITLPKTPVADCDQPRKTDCELDQLAERNTAAAICEQSI